MNSETEQLRNNFAPAMGMPWKLLRGKDAMADGRIRPLHIKMNINSRCNAACSFCSVRAIRNEDEELGTDELLEIADHFHALGTMAITICGNGEPTLHPGLGRFMERCAGLDIQLGLITNGLLWSAREEEIPANRRLIWARMSIIDSESGNYDAERLRRFARNLPDVAVSAYFTVTDRVSRKTAREIAAIIEEEPNATHVKFVEDWVNHAPKAMDALERELAGISKKLIFQRWQRGVTGNSPCLVSKLRPVVNANGFMHPCCTSPLTPAYRMTHWRDYNLDTPCFDGSVCATCDWSRYQEALCGLTAPLQHERFL